MRPLRAARVLIVDDSAVMRSLLRSVVTSDSRLEVAGVATDGASALQAIDTIRPDLILLDVEMPVMDGLSTLKQIKTKGVRVPVIMCSSLTQRGAKVTIDALSCGAADYVAKPAGQASKEEAIQSLAQDLIPKILALTAAATGGGRSLAGRSLFSTAGSGPSPAVAAHSFSSGAVSAGGAGRTMSSGGPAAAALERGTIGARNGSEFSQLRIPLGIAPAPAVILIGVSTGGPAALELVLPELPAGFPLPVLVVQHMPELFTRMLAERLDSRCALRVVEATHGEPVRPGTVYIAKGNWHMEVVAASGSDHLSARSPVLRLTQEAAENHCRPSVDVLFRTAATVYGKGALGVILTGMGSDGLAGCRAIRDRDGTVLAQDEATSTVWGMPGAVAQAGFAQRILPLNAITPELLRLTGRGKREALELRESAV